MRIVILAILAMAALHAQDDFEREIAAHPRHKSALYGSAGTVLAEIGPELAAARAAANLKPDDPGPLPDSGARQALSAKYGHALDEAIKRLRYAIQLDPLYFDAMARLNELLRARADLRDTADQYQADIAETHAWNRRIEEAKALKARQPIERIRIGGNVHMANLLRKPLPSCPAGVHVASTVELTVVIAKDGEVQDIQVLNGDPAVVPAVVAAINDWIYKPALLDNVPVEVITQVNVNMKCGVR